MKLRASLYVLDLVCLGLFWVPEASGRPPGATGKPMHNRFLGLVIWFVLGAGGLRKRPGGPGKAHGGPLDN